jgi:hypothetical protein
MAKAGNSLIETKVGVGSAGGISVGLLTWALVTFVPAWNAGIPDQLVPFLPIAAGWLTSTIAGYLAPHTHRPDLAEPVPAAVPVLPSMPEPPPAPPAREVGSAP